MLLLTGSSAFSSVQLKRLQQRIAKLVPHIDEVEAKWVYFIDSKAPLQAEQVTELAGLLNKPGMRVDHEQ